jgi:hypothetical protein
LGLQNIFVIDLYDLLFCGLEWQEAEKNKYMSVDPESGRKRQVCSRARKSLKEQGSY